MEYKEIREKQLRLFDDPEDEARGGGDVVTCSLPHPKPHAAKYQVYFRNGYYRCVCGRCVKKFQQCDNANVESIIKKNKK